MSLDIGEISVTMARLQPEEEFRAVLYDDATGLPVKAPVGNATIGYGCNVQAGWSKSLATVVLRQQVVEARAGIEDQPWFVKCNAARRSVLLDIAFNGGQGVIMQYKHLFAAIMNDDWQQASIEVHSSNPRLAGRYAILAKTMLTGEVC